MIRLTLLLGMLVVGCPKPLPTPPGPDVPDAGSPVTCLRACEHIHELGCDYDLACYDVCRKVKQQSFTDCLGNATSCYEVENCDP